MLVIRLEDLSLLRKGVLTFAGRLASTVINIAVLFGHF